MNSKLWQALNEPLTAKTWQRVLGRQEAPNFMCKHKLVVDEHGVLHLKLK